MSLSSLAVSVGRRSSKASSEIASPIEFIESPWGLNLKLFPIQRIIIKAHYGLALDDNPYNFPLDCEIPETHPNYSADLVDIDGCYLYRIPVTDFRKENLRYMTEAGYLRFLHSENRCNISEVIPGKERREMVLSVGRRSGKTLITACIVAYEAYKLLLKGNPQKYYGSSQSNVIQLISVATDRDQAGLLYREASGHFQKCEFFKPYTANSTQSYATFQTPFDIETYGAYKDNQKARYSVHITFRSCVAKGLRGGANLLVALDECAHFGEKGERSAEDVYQAVEPSTRTFSRKDERDPTKSVGENEGRIILISSPLGKQGLFYKQFMLGFGNNKAADALLCVQAPTWEVNPTVPAETFIASYLKDPNVFITEFGAEFSDRSRGWLEDKNDLLACVDPNLRPKYRAPSLQPHFLGLDFALKGDRTAAAVGHLNADGKICLDLIDSICAGEGEYEDLDRLDFDDVATWIEDICKRFYIQEGVFDQWYGIAMEQALQKKGLPQIKSTHFTDKSNSEYYNNFKNMMFDEKLVLYNWPLAEDGGPCEYIQELFELQAEYKSKYVMKVSAPNLAGKHDDLSDALIRMVWVASTHVSNPKMMTGVSSGTFSQSGAFFAGRSNRFGRSGSHPSRMVPKNSKGGQRW